MRREGFDIARRTVFRLIRGIGLEGAVCGKKPKIAIPERAPMFVGQGKPPSHAPAPNILWVSDFAYVTTSQGVVDVAFVIAVSARHIVGWRVSRKAAAGFVLDALKQAVHQRQPGCGPPRHSDGGSQYRSFRYTERLTEAGIEPSVGSVGERYGNALAETVNRLFKPEVPHRQGPWRCFDAAEYAAQEWVDWFNTRRLLEPIGNVPELAPSSTGHPV